MLELTKLADSVIGSQTPGDVWRTVSHQLREHGLHRTALHTALPLNAHNPFGAATTGPTFGSVWNAQHDRRLRSYAGDLRCAPEPDLWHLRPTLRFLSASRSPLFVDHRNVVRKRQKTAFEPLCRIMVEDLGQYQGLAFPLRDPATGTAAILSAWGDEDREDFTTFVQAHRQTLHLLGYYVLGMMETRWPGLFEAQSDYSQVLSDRERQVLSCFASGLATAQVADKLCIADRSVAEYVLRARTKLKARTRAEAVARATLLGLI